MVCGGEAQTVMRNNFHFGARAYIRMPMTQQLLVEFDRRSASVEIAFDYTIIMAVWMRLRGARRCVLVWVGVSYFILCYGA